MGAQMFGELAGEGKLVGPGTEPGYCRFANNQKLCRIIAFACLPVFLAGCIRQQAYLPTRDLTLQEQERRNRKQGYGRPDKFCLPSA
jgi:hypothetical protein